jgi:starvation-inducible DNA-binding protein
MIDRTLHAHEIVIEKVREAIETTEEIKDWGSNDMLMGDVLRRHELQVWFLAEHVVPVPLIDDNGGSGNGQGRSGSGKRS